MRALAIVLVVASARAAHAEPLPAGALEAFIGAESGAGADAKRLGYGYQLGVSAAWQPMKTERRVGPTVRWSVVFADFYNGTASMVNPPLRTVAMDLTVGARFRPWSTPSRYLTARAGGGMLRTNDPVSDGSRAYLGPVLAAGFDQYLDTFVVGVDVRYGFIVNGPQQIGIVLRVGLTGP